MVPILSQMHPVHAFPHCFPKIHSNVILPSTPFSEYFQSSICYIQLQRKSSVALNKRRQARMKLYAFARSITDGGRVDACLSSNVISDPKRFRDTASLIKKMSVCNYFGERRISLAGIKMAATESG
jgi:hypothetical protein